MYYRKMYKLKKTYFEGGYLFDYFILLFYCTKHVNILIRNKNNNKIKCIKHITIY